MSFKSFLNWIQEDKAPDQQADKKEGDWAEKRRDNRIELDPGKNITVHLMSEEWESGSKTLVAAVQNVSVRGCGLLFTERKERDRLAPKQILVASLAVDEFPIPLQVEVVRLIGDFEAAVRFKPPFPRELEKLERFLEPRCLGRSLREIDQNKLQKGPQKGLRWYQGVNETNLFSWFDADRSQIVQQQLVFLDRVVEWKGEMPARTGLIRVEERTTDGGVGWVQSELLDFDAVADPSLLAQAKTLIESAAIEESVRGAFLKKIS